MPKRSQLFVLPLQEARRPGRFVVLLWLLLALYAPFSWIALRSGPWDAKRMVWLKSWPALPGFVVQSLAVFESKPIWAGYAAMGVLTLLVLGVLFRIGRSSRTSLMLSIALATAFSSWNAWLAYQAF